MTDLPSRRLMCFSLECCATIAFSRELATGSRQENASGMAVLAALRNSNKVSNARQDAQETTEVT
jgi:hypothetical protein